MNRALLSTLIAERRDFYGLDLLITCVSSVISVPMCFQSMEMKHGGTEGTEMIVALSEM
jgi:hypothetical protein